MMATIKEIQSFVKSTYGFVPKSCWIADVKEICGIYVKPAPNRRHLDKRENPCPLEKVNAIKDALRHFKMI